MNKLKKLITKFLITIIQKLEKKDIVICILVDRVKGNRKGKYLEDIITVTDKEDWFYHRMLMIYNLDREN